MKYFGLIFTGCLVGLCDLLFVWLSSKVFNGSSYSDISLTISLFLLLIIISRQIFIGLGNISAVILADQFVKSNIQTLSRLSSRGYLRNSESDLDFQTLYSVKNNYLFPYLKSINSIFSGLVIVFLMLVFFVLKLPPNLISYLAMSLLLIILMFFCLRVAILAIANRFAAGIKKLTGVTEVFLDLFDNSKNNNEATIVAELLSTSTKQKRLEALQDFTSSSPRFILELLAIIVILSSFFSSKTDALDGLPLLTVGYGIFRIFTAAQGVLNGFSIYRFHSTNIDDFLDSHASFEKLTDLGNFRDTYFSNNQVTFNSKKVDSEACFQLIRDCKNQFTLMTGPSGSGKSILAKQIRWDAQAAGYKACIIDSSFKLYQPDLTGRQIIEKLPKSDCRKNIQEYEDIFIACDLLDLPLSKMSLGQRMRFSALFYITQDFDYLILDEMISSLDGANKKLFLSFLQKTDLKVILVDHNISKSVLEKVSIVSNQIQVGIVNA